MLIILSIIYIAFISLGLPDALLGSAWPLIHKELTIPLSHAGILSMLISGFTVVSGLLTTRLVRRMGTGLTSAFSVALTAVAMFGFSCSTTFAELVFWTIPFGLGAGAVDAALNNYVALHYSSRHMSWLHAFWGVGVILGPGIMEYSLTHIQSWEKGFVYAGLLQLIPTAILFLSLRLWDRSAITSQHDPIQHNHLTFKQIFKIQGVFNILIAFFCYCALERSIALWASSYMVLNCHISPEKAAGYAALFFIGLTSGRFLNGFIADRFGDQKMIRWGIFLILGGIAISMLPLSSYLHIVISFIIMGLGAAPIYPSIIHSTPHNFGKENSQALIGIQMASAYCGSTLMPMLFGYVADKISLAFFPIFLIFLCIGMLTMTEKLNNLVNSRQINN